MLSLKRKTNLGPLATFFEENSEGEKGFRCAFCISPANGSHVLLETVRHFLHRSSTALGSELVQDDLISSRAKMHTHDEDYEEMGAAARL